MNAQSWISFPGRTIRLSDLRSFDPATEVEAEVIDFCRDWLSQRNEFTLRTSGSTGEPKQIAVTRAQMESTARLQQEALGLTPGMNALLCLDARYIAGKMMIVRSLVAGMNLVVVPPMANPMGGVSSNIVIDFAAVVPYQIQQLVQANDWTGFSREAKIIIGGAALNATLLRSLPEVPVSCIATFGMTETLSHVALQALNGPARRDYFETLRGVTISTDSDGCLVVQAPHISANAIVTNDIVEMLSNTTFRWLGRRDNVINSGGVKVMPEKVEATIAAVFSMLGIANRYFVAGLPDDRLGQAVVLLVEGQLPEQINHELLKNLKERLSRFECPRKIINVPAFKETPTGKVNRRETVDSLK